MSLSWSPTEKQDPGIAAVGGERVRRVADVRSDQDLPVQVLGGQLRQRQARAP